MLCAKDIMREEIMGRHHLRTFYFGCGPNGLRHVISWIVFCFVRRFRAYCGRTSVFPESTIRGTAVSASDS